MRSFVATLEPNGDGTGDLKIICRGVKFTPESEHGLTLVNVNDRLPFTIKSGDEVHRPRIVLKVFSAKKNRRESRLEAAARRLRTRKATLFNHA